MQGSYSCVSQEAWYSSVRMRAQESGMSVCENKMLIAQVLWIYCIKPLGYKDNANRQSYHEVVDVARRVAPC